MSAERETADLQRRAAERADWQQVVLNGGPPCFHLEGDGSFCLRAERWDGHRDGVEPYPYHRFVSLADLLAALSTRETPPQSLTRLVIDLQAHAREHGWQDVDDPLDAVLAWQPRETPPHIGDLVTCSLRDPEHVCHLPRLDCQHEAPHLIAACGAFMAQRQSAPDPSALEQRLCAVAMEPALYYDGKGDALVVLKVSDVREAADAIAALTQAKDVAEARWAQLKEWHEAAEEECSEVAQAKADAEARCVEPERERGMGSIAESNLGLTVLLEQIRCPHLRASGRGDEISCADCGLTWTPAHNWTETSKGSEIDEICRRVTALVTARFSPAEPGPASSELSDQTDPSRTAP